MSKTLKDLNWSLYVVNMILAISGAVLVIYGNGITGYEGIFWTVLIAIAKDNISFFSEAKKKLSE